MLSPEQDFLAELEARRALIHAPLCERDIVAPVARGR